MKQNNVFANVTLYYSYCYMKLNLVHVILSIYKVAPNFHPIRLEQIERTKLS